MNFDELPTIKLSTRQKDYTGIKKGNLTYIKPSKKAGGRTYWWMLCNCGNIVEFRSDAEGRCCHECAAKNRKIKLKNKNAIDITN